MTPSQYKKYKEQVRESFKKDFPKVYTRLQDNVESKVEVILERVDFEIEQFFLQKLDNLYNLIKKDDYQTRL